MKKRFRVLVISVSRYDELFKQGRLIQFSGNATIELFFNSRESFAFDTKLQYNYCIPLN